MSGATYVSFFPPFGVLGGPTLPWPLTIGADALDLGAHCNKDMLLIAEPFDNSTGVSLGLFGPFGELPYPSGGSWGWTGGRTTLYVACTTGRSTAADDTPAGIHVPGRLQPFNYGYQLFSGVDPLARSRAGTGVVTVIDPDHELNSLIGRLWDSAPITIKRGARGTNFSTWETVGRFRSAGLLNDIDTKQIRLRDLGWQLGGPLHAELYAGTGALEGDATIKGSFKPWGFGYCFNAEPVLLSASSQIFQFSLSSSAAVTAVRHGGAALTFDADYPTYAALAAAAIPSSKYGTCLAQSLVRPNVTLQFGIRIDFTGDADVVNGHPGPLTRASIARRIATSRGSNALADASEIDTTAFDRMESYHTAPVGWYFRDVISKADALDRVLAGVLGWWRVKPDGRLTVGWVEDPGAVTPSIVIPYGAEGMSNPRMIDTAPPRRATYIAYKTNYGPTPDRASLAGSVSDADAAIYGQTARYGSATTTPVATLYPSSVTVAIDEAGFRDEADASLEAQRQQNILGVERKRWAMEFDIDPFADVIGVGFGFTGANDLGLGDAATMICVGVDTPGASSSTFEFLA